MFAKLLTKFECRSTAYAAMSVAVIVFFGPTLFYGPISLDDGKHIFANTYYLPPTWLSLVEIWTKPYFDLYIPVMYSAWHLISSASIALFGNLDPLAFHLTNIVFHLVNTFLVFELVILISGVKRSYALLAAMVFCIHPMQVEPVVWIAALKDVLSSFFFLAALYLCLSLSSAERRCKIRYLLALALYVLAILSKPNTVMLPLLGAAIAIFIKNQNPKDALKTYLPFVFMALPIVWITQNLQTPVQVSHGVPLWGRPFIAFDTLAFYLGKFIWPWPLVLDYGRTPESVFKPLLMIWPFVLAAAGFLIHKRRSITFVIRYGLLLAIVLSPFLGIIAFLFQTNSTVSDRYFYLPMFIMAVFLGQIAAQRRWRLVGVFLLFLAPLTFHQVRKWHEPDGIFLHTYKHNPASWLSIMNLAFTYMEHRDFGRAERYYKIATQKHPHVKRIWLGLGISQIKSNNPAGYEAVQKFLDLNANSFEARYMVGTNFLNYELYEQAFFVTRSLLEEAPTLPQLLKMKEQLSARGYSFP